MTELRWGTGSIAERAYFTTFIDAYNDEILAWNIGLHPTVEFVTKTLDELLKQRSERHYRMTIHSDQGCQYQNCDDVSRLAHNRVFQSMSRQATCLYNAMAESIFHIVKVETVHNNHYQNYDELKSAVTDYVYYYNNKRIKTKLAGKTPVSFRSVSRLNFAPIFGVQFNSDWVVFFVVLGTFGDSLASTFLAIACRHQVQHAVRILSSKRNTFHLLTKSQKYKNRMSQKSDILNELNQITYFGGKMMAINDSQNTATPMIDATTVNAQFAHEMALASQRRRMRAQEQIKAEVLGNKNIDYQKHMKWCQ